MNRQVTLRLRRKLHNCGPGPCTAHLNSSTGALCAHLTMLTNLLPVFPAWHTPVGQSTAGAVAATAVPGPAEAEAEAVATWADAVVAAAAWVVAEARAAAAAAMAAPGPAGAPMVPAAAVDVAAGEPQQPFHEVGLHTAALVR